MRYLNVLLFLCILNSCADEAIVKPGAELRLEYDAPEYESFSMDCPFEFQKNQMASVVEKEGCGVNIVYPSMKATVYLTYREVIEDSLNALLVDAQKLAYGHNIKANEIFEQPRVDTLNDIYGMFYMINGEAASQSQFYVTDSTDHFISGALYFEAKPNFDSIYPAVVYLRDDIRRIMETISWKEE